MSQNSVEMDVVMEVVEALHPVEGEFQADNVIDQLEVVVQVVS